MHDAVRDIAIIREQQQSLCVSVEPADWIDALSSLDKIHDGPTIALIFDCGDVARRFVEKNVSRLLGTEELAIDANLRVHWIGLCAQLGHNLPIDRDASGRNQLFSFAP